MRNLSIALDRKLSRFAGFSVVGIIVTLLSCLLIYVFVGIFQLNVYTSYLVIYFATILLSYYLNGRFVFNVGLSSSDFVRYLFVYVSGMMIGVLCIWVYTKVIPLPHWILAYLAIPVTVMWNFLLVSMVFGVNRNE